jgi:hypothetical protein
MMALCNHVHMFYGLYFTVGDTIMQRQKLPSRTKPQRMTASYDHRASDWFSHPAFQ